VPDFPRGDDSRICAAAGEKARAPQPRENGLNRFLSSVHQSIMRPVETHAGAHNLAQDFSVENTNFWDENPRRAVEFTREWFLSQLVFFSGDCNRDSHKIFLHFLLGACVAAVQHALY
jgi:hypothetical protein